MVRTLMYLVKSMASMSVPNRIQLDNRGTQVATETMCGEERNKMKS